MGSEISPNFENKIIQVCAKCLDAACYHGEFLCDEARNASTVKKTVRELRKLAHEHEEHWSDDKLAAVYGEPTPFGYHAERTLRT